MIYNTEGLATLVHSKLKIFFSGLMESSTAVAFSGGLDSSVILALCPENFSAYVAGASDSGDVNSAIRASQLLGRNCREIIASRDDVVGYARTVMEIDPEIDLRDLGFETVLATVLDRTDEKTLITGQGADELFYGYSRFISDPGMTNKDSLEKLYKITLPRETRIASYFGKRLICPYLESGISEIPGISMRKNNISGTENKLILRQVASLQKIPSEIVTKKKRAAQYGSGFMKILKKDLFPELRKNRR